MQIEEDFLDAMKKVYPTVEKDSQQFKASRVVFYMGAFNMVTSIKIGASESELRKSINELQGALKFTSEFAKKGLQPEETLADYVEKDE